MDPNHTLPSPSLSQTPSKQCSLCEQTFIKSPDAHYSCILCTKSICESCSVSQDNSVYRYCVKCYKFLIYLPSSSIQQLQLEAVTNHELSSKVTKLQEEITVNVKRLKRLNNDLDSLDEKQTIIDTLQTEVDQNVLKIKEVTIGIKTLNLENEEMERILCEKAEIIEVLSQELTKIKSEAAENKRNSNAIPPECSELYQENQELKSKLKEMEQDHITYTQQLVESLELLKSQLIKERNENSETRSRSDSSNDIENSESIEIEKSRIKELQEELRISRRQLELMRASRVDIPGKSKPGALHDKKKCEVF